MRYQRPARRQQFRDWVNNAPVWQSAVAALLLAVATLTGTVAALRAGFSVQPGPGHSRPLSSPEPTYTTGPSQNHVFDTNVFRFTYTSLVTPNSTYDYNMDTHQGTLLKRSLQHILRRC